MSLKTIALGLTLKIPNRGHNPWTSDFETEFAEKISQHGHTGSGDGAQIGTGAIVNAAVTAAKLGTDAVETAKIKDGEVTLAKLAAAVIAGLMPTGTILMTGRATAPSGYLLCDGSAISRATYSDLFTAIGTAYGAGNGSTTFNLPAGDRFPVSKGTTLSTLGAVGGALDHTHTGPSHAHSTPAHFHGDGTLAIGASGGHVHVATDGADGATNFVMSGGIGANANAYGSSGYKFVDPFTTSANHVHANANFTGLVGNVASGIDGDAAMTSEASGTGATDSNNPPYQVHNFMIKT